MRKPKTYHSENCDTCVRGVYHINEYTTITICGQYAHCWSITITKTVFGQEQHQRHEFANGTLARKALQILLRKNKPNQIK